MSDILNSLAGENFQKGVNAFQIKYFFINFFHSKHIVKLFCQKFFK